MCTSVEQHPLGFGEAQPDRYRRLGDLLARVRVQQLRPDNPDPIRRLQMVAFSLDRTQERPRPEVQGDLEQ